MLISASVTNTWLHHMLALCQNNVAKTYRTKSWREINCFTNSYLERRRLSNLQINAHCIIVNNCYNNPTSSNNPIQLMTADNSKQLKETNHKMLCTIFYTIFGFIIVNINLTQYTKVTKCTEKYTVIIRTLATDSNNNATKLMQYIIPLPKSQHYQMLCIMKTLTNHWLEVLVI